MNDHDDIRKLLSAHCSGDLDPDLTLRVERHLAECPACRAELADLKISLQLLRTTPEVEPPPWLTARVMARITAQQAEKRSWLQRIFLPLHIKLPLEALALLMVCVTGWYISRTVVSELNKPELQELRDVPATAPPSAEQVRPEKRGEAVSPLPQSPAASTTPATEAGTVQQPAVTPYKSAPPTAPPPAPAPAPASPKAESSVPAGTGKPESLKTAPAAETYNRSREAMSDFKSKDSSLERPSGAPAPAAGRTTAKPSPPSIPQISLRLQPVDRSAAPEAVRDAFIRCGGIISKEDALHGRLIKGRIVSSRLAELMRHLQHIGRVAELPAPAPGSEELEVTVQW